MAQTFKSTDSVANSKKEDASLWFFNKWAKSYDRCILTPWLRSVQNKAVAKVNGGKVLDVGCGTGQAMLQLIRKADVELHGIDVSADMLAVAKKKLYGKEVRLTEASVYKIPYPDNHFDYLVSTEMFHHLGSPIRALKEMRRVLKRGGVLILTDVNILPLFLSRLAFKVEPGFVDFYSKRKFFGMFEREGFKVMEQKRVGLGFALMNVARK